MNILSTHLTSEGLRGIIARDWTFDLIRQVASRISAYIAGGNFPGPNGVLIGYDTRFLSDRYAAVLAETLSSLVPVSLVTEPISLPHHSYRVREGRFGLGLYVNGGILSPDYSGLCFLGANGSFLPQKVIQEMLAAGNPSSENGTTDRGRTGKPIRVEPGSAYGEWALRGISLRNTAGWRRDLVVDINHGTTQRDFRATLTRAGIYFRVVKSHRDVLFGGRTPDLQHQSVPFNHERRESPFLAIAVDPTGQRFTATDQVDKWLAPEILLPCLLAALVQHHNEPFVVVRTMATTHWVETLLTGLPVQFKECLPGPAHLSRAVVTENAQWGLDESGCLIDAAHLPVPDGVRASLCLLQALAETDGHLSQWVQKTVAQYPPPARRTLEFRLAPSSLHNFLDSVRRAPLLRWLDYPLERATDKNGIKFVFRGNRWIYFLPFPLESRIEVFLETPVADEIEHMEDRILEMTNMFGVMKR